MYIELSAQCPAHGKGQSYVAVITVVEVGGRGWC